MSEPEPPKDSPKAELPADSPKANQPAAPRLGELLELSLTALVNAPGVFRRLTERPVPGPGASFLTALAMGGTFFALNLIRVALSYPAQLQAFEPWKIGLVFAAALGVWTALFLLLSSFVYGLGRALGSAGDFDRALLVAAVTLATAPVQALCGWFDSPLANHAWVVPALLAAWILACGLSAQFKADSWGARGVCAALAAGALALQYGAGLLVEKYAGPARLAAAAVQSAPSPDQLADLQKQMQQIQAIAIDASANAQVGGDPDDSPHGDSASDSPKGDSASDSPKANRSSLDLLRGPSDAPQANQPGLTREQQLARMNASGDAVNKSVIGMLDSIGPMLNNPVITRNFTPAQKADYAELTKLIADLKTGMAANTITSPQQQQAQMMKIQGLVMRLMSGGIATPKAAPAPAEKK